MTSSQCVKKIVAGSIVPDDHPVKARIEGLFETHKSSQERVNETKKEVGVVLGNERRQPVPIKNDVSSDLPPWEVSDERSGKK